ncbi:MAG TPA: hypothetical protein VLC07_06220, partial [Solirubrobacterales bacterium]|nr:hypothetical protein [Solirubrobacterales bacterium]
GEAMKTLKMVVLAATVAAAAVAVLGAGTASATKLCENNQTTNCTNDVLKGTVVKFTAEESIRTTGPFNLLILTCTESTIEGSVTSTGGEEGIAVTMNVIGLTFGNCTRPVTVVNKGMLSIQHIAGTDNGTVTSTGLTKIVHEIPGFGTCAFATNITDIGTLTGSLVAPTIDINANIASETSGCPNDTWAGKYIYTGSTPFIVSTN